MRVLFLLALGLAAVVAVPASERIIGGSLTTINQHPYLAAILYSANLNSYWQNCGSAILTTTSVLTSAACTYGLAANRLRVRVGSTYANSGGTIHNVRRIVNHQSYNSYNYDHNIAVIRTVSVIRYIANTVAPASIASPNYHLADNQQVWAMGWGHTSYGGVPSEQLRHVQIWTVNQVTCRNRYAEVGRTVTDNMLCSGWLDVGGRDQCTGDSGGPLMHNNIVVGVASWGNQCGLARYPGVNTRVSRYTNWIQSAAAA